MELRRSKKKGNHELIKKLDGAVNKSSGE